MQKTLTYSGFLIACLITTEEGAVDEVVESIEEVESRSKWQNLLYPDYKNLGQLRSDLAHSTNSIRKLSKTLDSVLEGSASALVQTQLQVLEQERERIVDIIQQNESQFSILGWVARLLTGYDNTPAGEGPETTESSGDMGL